jgi:hypothetical protein
MKLMTKELEEAFTQQGDTSEKDPKDIKILAKFFNPMGRQKWYATEYDPESRIFFGFVSLFGDYNDELGTFSLDELEAVELPLGLKLERDLHFGEHTLAEVLDGARP